MKISKKREAGKILYRDGLSARIIALATDIAEGSFKNAIERAGQISVLVEAATFDDYWDSKALRGKYREQTIMLDLIDGHVTKERAVKFVNPYLPSRIKYPTHSGLTKENDCE